MTTTPIPPAVSGGERLHQAERELVALRRRINRTTGITILIGIALLVLVGVYFYIGYGWLKEVTVPENLVTLGQRYLDDNLPTAKKWAEERIVKSVPPLLASLSDSTYESLPEYQKKLESTLMERLDVALEESKLVGEEEFRNFLRQNRDMMKKSFKELAANPKKAESNLNELVAAIEQDFDFNLRDQAAEFLDGIKSFNEYLLAAAYDQDKSEEGKLTRKLGMLARRFWLDATEPGKAYPVVKTFRTPKILATVRSVDSDKNTLTVTVRHAKKDVERSYPVLKGLKPAGAGKAATLADLKAGTPVELQLSPSDNRTVTGITVRKAKEK